MLKLLADENIAPTVIRALREEGFDVLSVYEEKLLSAPDEEVLKLGQKQKRIVLTHDKDFGNLIRQPFSQTHSGVILLRLRNQSPPNVIRHLTPFLKKIEPSQLKNRLVILREGRIRII